MQVALAKRMRVGRAALDRCWLGDRFSRQELGEVRLAITPLRQQRTRSDHDADVDASARRIKRE